MRRVVRLVIFLLVAGAFSLGYGTVSAVGSRAHDVAMDRTSHTHDAPIHDREHGPTGDGAAHHCGTATCAPVMVVIQPDRSVLREARRFVRFAVPPLDRHFRSAYLEHDPPIPRSFS